MDEPIIGSILDPTKLKNTYLPSRGIYGNPETVRRIREAEEADQKRVAEANHKAFLAKQALKDATE